MIDFFLQKSLHAANGQMLLDVSCKIEDGEFIGLYGMSGAGKTSLLRMLAGLMKPESGFIKVDDEIWFDSEKKINLVPQQRHVGIVFQEYALFPNMNVEENILFALAKNASKNYVGELLEIMELQNLRKKNIQHISGGQQQRVALARALVCKPKLLLLDEPLSAVDEAMRKKMQQILLQIHASFFINIILVSHDIGEIVKLTSRTLNIENGLVKNFNSSSEIFPGCKNEQLPITGIFISKEKKGNMYLLEMLSGSDSVNIYCSENDCKDLQKGDKIIVSLNIAATFVRKLQQV